MVGLHSNYQKQANMVGPHGTPLHNSKLRDILTQNKIECHCKFNYELQQVHWLHAVPISSLLDIFDFQVFKYIDASF